MDNNFGNITASPIGAVAAYPGLIWFALAYFIGSIPFGLILIKIVSKKDIRNIGSGNIGATNVLRSGNKTLAALTLILDALKATPIIFFTWLGFHTGKFYYQDINSSPHSLLLLLGLIAIIGHCFPVWLKFKGGKGVATTLGALLAAVPFVGLIACTTWLLSAFAFKISSLAALIAVAVAPIATFFLYGTAPALVCVLITLLVFIRHKDNIKRLLNGSEPKIGDKKKKEAQNAAPVSE